LCTSVALCALNRFQSFLGNSSFFSSAFLESTVEGDFRVLLRELIHAIDSNKRSLHFMERVPMVYVIDDWLIILLHCVSQFSCVDYETCPIEAFKKSRFIGPQL